MPDVVVELTGNPKGISQSIDLVRMQGTVVNASVIGSNVGVPLPTDKIAFNEIRFQGVFTNGGEAMRAAVKLAEQNKYPLAELVTHRYPLEKAEEAVKAAGGEIPGLHPIKVVIVP